MNDDLAGHDLREAQQVIYEGREAFGGAADDADLLLLLRGEPAVDPVRQEPRQRENRVQ
jgi:hypothetical protein